MIMKCKPDLEQIKYRMEAFWQSEMLDRACISVRAPYDPGLNISPFKFTPEYYDADKGLEDYWLNPESIAIRNKAMIQNTFFGGDALPSVFLNFGTSGHCQYFGARPKFNNDTIWFDPVFNEIDPEQLQFEAQILKSHLNIAAQIISLADDEYLVGMPDHCGTLDALAHLYGTETILLAMAEKKERLLKAVEILNGGWQKANEAFFQLTKSVNQGAVHSWMDLWAPGRVTHMQCDLSVMISPGAFNEFVMPELEAQLEWLEYPVYHFDGIEQARHLDSLLSLKKLKAIQWTHVAGQPAAKDHIEVLQKMQKAGKSLIIMTPAEDIPKLLSELSPAGLYLHCEVDDYLQAMEIVSYVEQNS